MFTTPSVIVFDVNETLSDMGPLGKAFEQSAMPASLTGHGSRNSFVTGSPLHRPGTTLTSLTSQLTAFSVCSPRR